MDTGDNVALSGSASGQGMSSNVAPSAQGNSVQTQTASETMLPSSKVNEIIRERLSEKESRLRKEFEAEKASWQTQQPTQNMGGMPQMSQDQLRSLIAEEAKKQQDQLAQQYYEHLEYQNAQKTVSEVLQKFDAAKTDYPDFEAKVTSLQLDKIPQIVKLANGVDNTAAVMYELAENPHKIANILQFASNQQTQHLAEIAMKRLSDSIKQNQQAANAATANEPLSHIKPSVTAGTDNGKKGIRDLRKQDWMRA